MTNIHKCSFCKKPHTKVGPLVEGPDGLYICEECAETALAVLAKEREKRLAEQGGES